MTFFGGIEDAVQQTGFFCIIDLRHDLPMGGHNAVQSESIDNKKILTISDIKQFLPFYAVDKVKVIEKTDAVFFIQHKIQDLESEEIAKKLNLLSLTD